MYIRTEKRRLAHILVLASVAATAFSQVPFNPVPSWESIDKSSVSTGAALVDINNDGWLDLVVANGNDMQRQHLVVYLSQGGSLPLKPSWQSADSDYHGHLAIGDVNGDGFSDVAVSVYLGLGGFGSLGGVKIYMNRNGTLESFPSWRSADSMYTFRCAFGDANGDGKLDLAVACGDDYTKTYQRNRMYFNLDTVLQRYPGWISDEVGASMCVTWGDIDNDGDLDLVFTNGGNFPNRIYINSGNSIATSAGWTSTDNSRYGNTIVLGDTDGDGFLDLGVADNNQLGGSGNLKIYHNTSGVMSTTPFWQSYVGYGSSMAFADVNNDGQADLLAGVWWGGSRIYINQGGNFSNSPDWQSTPKSVVEKIAVNDVRKLGVRDTREAHSAGGKKVFYLLHQPTYSVDDVAVGKEILPRSKYCYDLNDGWISLAGSPRDTVYVRYSYSCHLDFAVSNWDNDKGNYVFLNTIPVVVAEVVNTPAGYELCQNYPNPFNPTTTIAYTLSEQGYVSLDVFDLLGRRVRTLINGFELAGHYQCTFDAREGFGRAISSGLYLYRLQSRSFTSTRMMMLVR
jgi:hypothetical protein